MKRKLLKKLSSELIKKTSDGDEVQERIEKETEYLEKNNLLSELLYAQSIAKAMRAATEKGYYVGKGASSLVFYQLGITNVDPIKYGLIFEEDFCNNTKKEDLFCWYATTTTTRFVINELFKEYHSGTTCASEDRSVLSVKGKRFFIENELDRLQKIEFETDLALRSPRISAYKEDYLHLLHYIAGFSYSEAIRVFDGLLTDDNNEIATARNRFMEAVKGRINVLEAQRLFERIWEESHTAVSKSASVSIDIALSEIFPF